MVADGKAHIRRQPGVRQGVLESRESDALRRPVLGKEGDDAPVHLPLQGEGLILDGRPAEVIVIEIAPGPVPPEVEQGLEVRQGVVQPLAAGAAVKVELCAALPQPLPDCQHGVGVVLLHWDADEVGEVLGLLHGVEVPQQEVRRKAQFPAEAEARVRGDDDIPGLRRLPEAVKAPGGKDEAAFHGKIPSWRSAAWPPSVFFIV